MWTTIWKQSWVPWLVLFTKHVIFLFLIQIQSNPWIVEPFSNLLPGCLTWLVQVLLQAQGSQVFFASLWPFFSSALYILEESCLLSVARFWTLCEPAPGLVYTKGPFFIGFIRIWNQWRIHFHNSTVLFKPLELNYAKMCFGRKLFAFCCKLPRD